MSNLPVLGRRNLEDPPRPTTAPEQKPRLAQQGSTENQSEAPSLGSIQQVGVILQMATGLEKGILALANILPGFGNVAAQIIPQIKAGVEAGLSRSNSLQGSSISGVNEEAVQPEQASQNQI